MKAEAQQIASADFNPRSREGSDLQRAVAECFYHIISIHAPARGATI